MVGPIGTSTLSKRAIWIVGGIAVIVAVITMVIAVRHFGWLLVPWLIPFLFLAGAVALWHHRSGVTRVILLGACVLSIVAIAAYDVHASFYPNNEASTKVLVKPATDIPKPAAGTPANPPATTSPPAATPDPKDKALADMKAAMEKMQADMAAMQAKNGTSADGEKDSGGKPAGDAGSPLPTGELGGILPEGVKSGEEGSLPLEAKRCWYSHPNELSCKFFIENKDLQFHSIDVMDSSGTIHSPDENKSFPVWRSDGSIKFRGDLNRAVLIHDDPTDIVTTITDAIAGATHVSFIVNVSGMDAVLHTYTFSKIPVVNLYQ